METAIGLREPFADIIDAPETLEVVMREKDGKFVFDKKTLALPIEFI